MKLNSKQLNALKKSIQHWEENLNILLLNYLSHQPLAIDVSIGGSHCECCIKFVDEYCHLCPIFLTTKAVWCENTPYRKVVELIKLERYFNNNTFQTLYKAISDELEFLYTILNNSNKGADTNEL